MFYNLIFGITLFSLIIEFLYNKYLIKVFSEEVPSKINGYEVCEKIIKENNYEDIKIEIEDIDNDYGQFVPKKKTIFLSKKVKEKNTLMSLFVGTHESMHLLQFKNDYAPFKIFLKNFKHLILVEAIFILLFFLYSIFGLIIYINKMITNEFLFFNILNFSDYMILFLYLVIILFKIFLIIPIEYNANKNALIYLKKNHLVTDYEYKRIKKYTVIAFITYIIGIPTTYYIFK